VNGPARRRILASLVAVLIGSVVMALPASAAAPPTVPWAVGSGNSANDTGRAVAALPDGSAIVTGDFQGVAAFGLTTLTSRGENDVFVAKVNADGTFAWAVQAGGTGYDFGRGIAALPDGSAIITGSFTGSADFGIPMLTSAGGNDAFVAKVNADGTFAWAVRGGGSGDVIAHAVSALADGSSFITGEFVGAAQFGVASIGSVGGSADMFVARVNADGTFAWATQGGGSSAEVGYGVDALDDGSAVVTGFLMGTAQFGATPLTSAGQWDVVVAKVNANGTFAWATRAGGSGYDIAYGVAALTDGSAIITGQFDGSADFGTTSLTGAGDRDVFAAKVSATGTFAWASQAGGSGFDSGHGISALADGSAFITGYFQDAAQFGSTTLASAGSTDPFLAEVSANGTFARAVSGGGAGNDGGQGVSALPDGSIKTTGYFVGAATFGPTTLTSAGSGDIFIASALFPQASPAAGPLPAAEAPARAKDSAVLSATVTAPRRRVVSGQAVRLGIRVRNTGTAGASPVTACLRLPRALAVVRRNTATRSGRAYCFRLASLAAGAQATRHMVVRATTTRRVVVRVTGTVRAPGVTDAPVAVKTVVTLPRR